MHDQRANEIRADEPATLIGVEDVGFGVPGQRLPPAHPLSDRPNQAITVEEALRAITINAARQIGMEEWLGTLETGKEAGLTDPGVTRYRIESIGRASNGPNSDAKDGRASPPIRDEKAA